MADEKIETAEISETQPSVDVESALADISSELFGQGDDEGKSKDEGEKDKASGSNQVEAPYPSPQAKDVSSEAPKEGEAPTEEGGENTAAVVETGAPKTWSKEAIADWATVSPRAQQEILKREEDMMRGIAQYKGAAELGQSYDKVVEPYRAALEADNIDPVQMFQSFSANHYLLSRGTPQQKVELAANLLSGYQIPLPELLEYMADNLSEPTDPKVAALERRLEAFETSARRTTNAAQEQQTARVIGEVEAFAADPAHLYFNELATDIGKLFESGLATTLEEAYDKAVFANPVTRQKEIERLTAANQSTADTAEQARKDKIARSTADSVTLTPKQRNGTVPIGSLDDTLAETMASISSRA